MIDQAIEYIENGLSIHLLYPFAKNPVKKDWSNFPKLNAEDIYEEFKEHPQANIGVKLGEQSKIGEYFLYALDLDISSNSAEDIIEAHEKIRSVYSDYINLPTMRSSSPNSRHFYFLSKKVLKNKKIATSSTKVNKIVNGENKVKNSWEIDLMATGRQVVIAPSVFNNNTYKWEENKNLIDFLNDETKKATMILDTINIFSDEEKVIQNRSDDLVINLKDIKEVLNQLSNEWIDDYDKWLSIGMALHHEYADTDDEQEAISLYDNWSKTSDKYEKNSCFKKWKSFTKKEDGITIATLLQHKVKVSKMSRIEEFSKFINDESIDLDNLKEKIISLKITDVELEIFMQDIADSLSVTFAKKISAVTSRKFINAFKKEAKIEAIKNEAKLEIGLDNALAKIILKNIFSNGDHLVHISKSLFIYKNGCWRETDADSISNLVYNEIFKVIQSESEEYALVKKEIFLTKKNNDMNGLTNQIVNVITKLVSSSSEDDILNLQCKRESNYSVINTLNKEVYIDSVTSKVTVQDHKFDSYLITQMNVNYDPGAQCPNFKLALKNVFQEHDDADEVIRHLLECIGFSIQNKKPLDLAMFMIWIGGGKNGKSFIKDIIMSLFNVNSFLSVSISKFIQSAHAEAGLLGKTILVDDDFKKGDFLDDGFVKKTSASSLMTGNPKFKGPITFLCYCTSLILANNNPQCKDVSDGMGRRAQVFPFNHMFTNEEIDSKLGAKIALERSGILNLLIESYINLQKRGHYKVPLSVAIASKKWINASNPFAEFLGTKFVITGDHKDRIGAQKAYDMYKTFVRSENESGQLNRNNFKNDMLSSNNIKYIKDSHEKVYYYTGIKIV